MRKPAPLLALLLGIFGAALPIPGHAGFSLFKNYWGNVLVATDMTPEGRALTPPTPQNPVYYLGSSIGEKLGTIPGDELPDKKKLTAFVTTILAKQGYLGARPGVHEPALYLVLQWGYLEPRSNDLLWFLGYDPAQDIGAPAFPGQLGPEIWRRGFRSRTVETILDGANGPIYGIIVTAFDYKTARSPNPVIYWQTRIGLPANGKSMADALPTMVLAAADAIGRPSKSPQLRSADDARDGHVRLDDLKILDVVGEPFRAADAPRKD
jgi:hypothetical protein